MSIFCYLRTVMPNIKDHRLKKIRLDISLNCNICKATTVTHAKRIYRNLCSLNCMHSLMPFLLLADVDFHVLSRRKSHPSKKISRFFS